MNKNDTFQAEITGYNSEGSGIARINGRAVFARGAARGDLAEIKITKITSKAVWGKLMGIIKPSPHRLPDGCPLYPLCGGCDFQHVSHAEELEAKLERVQSALLRIAGVSPAFDGIISDGNTLGYRNKAVIPVGYDGEAAVSGFYRSGSHDIVPCENCYIQSNQANRAAAAVRSWMTTHGIPAYDETARSGLIRRVYVRVNGDGRSLVSIVAASPDIPRRAELISVIRENCPDAAGILINVNSSPGNAVLSGGFVTLWGAEHITDGLLGLGFRLSPGSFYQVNRKIAEMLYTRAIEYAQTPEPARILDLYCGTGTLSLCLARHSRQVVGIEISPDAVADACLNAEINGVANARFIRADASDTVGVLRGINFRPEVITVDPPRKGLDKDVIGTILELRPEKLVYISCDPATLSRDIAILGKNGWRAVRYSLADMFPRTANVECVALLEPQ